MLRTSTLFALVVGLLAMAPIASAQEQASTDSGPAGELRIGKLYSFGGGTDLQHGFGLDLRYHVFPQRGMDGYLGLFGQGQYELGDAWRFAGGLSAGWGIFGIEVGVSHRTETATMAGSTGLHVAQAFTFGPLSVGGRLTIPLVDHGVQGTTMGVQGIEGALVLRLGFGCTVHGQLHGHGSHGCRAHHGGGGVRDPHAAHGHGH